MTAKEILLDVLPHDCYWEEMDNLSNTPSHYVESVIKEYARQKCKEQREICAMYSETPTLYGTIRNAPEPKFD